MLEVVPIDSLTTDSGYGLKVWVPRAAVQSDVDALHVDSSGSVVILLIRVAPSAVVEVRFSLVATPVQCKPVLRLRALVMSRRGSLLGQLTSPSLFGAG